MSWFTRVRPRAHRVPASKNRGHSRSNAVLELVELESRIAPAGDLLTYHGDNYSRGVNNQESVLTQANVNSTSFGKLFSTPVDGQVYAQPLYVSNVNITVGPSPGVHNVAYVATEGDSLYAINADNGQVLWKNTYVNPAAGVTTINYLDVKSTNIVPQIGITGTPVIDPSTNTIFFDAFTKEVVSGQTHYVHRLHAVDITNGAERPGGPVTVGDTIWDGTNYTYVSGPSIPGAGDGSINGVLTFNALRALQRPALTLNQGVVYVTFASHEDNGPYHGWIFGYNANTLALSAVFNATPNGSNGGIWQSGGKVVVDDQGFMYFVTGNGDFDTTLNAQGFPINGNYGDSLVKLAVDPTSTAANPNINGWGLKVIDYFTPYNQAILKQYDTDLGSGAPLILPDSVGSATHPHLLVFAGKEGTIYLVDRDNLGRFDPAKDNVVQVLYNQLISSSFGTPAYFNNTIYYVGAKNSDKAQTFSIANGQLSTTATTRSLETFSYPGNTPTITTNGSSTDGVVWTLNTNPGALRAYGTAGFGQLLYSSDQAANNRDTLGAGSKFQVATAANGKVYVGTSSALVVYGLLLPPTTVPKPASSLVATPLSSAQVALGWTDDPDNFGPNETSIDIEASTDGVNFSLIASAAAHATSFTATGLSPSTTYTFRIRTRNGVGASTYSNTAVTTTLAAVGAGGIDFSSGFTGASASLTINGSAAMVGSSLRLTNGGQSQAGSAFTTTKIEVTKFTNRLSFQLTSAAADGLTFTIQGAAPTARGVNGGGLGYGAGNTGGTGGIPTSVAIKFDLYNSQGEGDNSTGLYLNGAAPTNVGSTGLNSAGINFHNGNIFNVFMSYDGATLTVTITDAVTGATKTSTYTVDIPANVGGSTAYVGFTGATGGLTAVQDILSWTYVPATVPTAPTNLAAVAASGTEIDLTWTNTATNQTGFKVERSTDGTSFAVIGSPTGTTFADLGVNPGQQYFYRVRATNSAGDSTPTPVVSATTPTPPVTPSGGTPTLVTANQVVLTWIDNSNNETGFRISRKPSGGTFKDIATLPANTTQFIDNTVTPGTQYDYHVAAFNSAGSVDFTGISVTTLSATGGVDFSTGFNNVGGVLQFNGGAKLNGTSLRLTDGTSNVTSSVFTTSPLDVTAFATTFRAQLTNATADGFTFVVQNTAPTAIGQGGGGLGYGAGAAGGAGGIGQSVAVKFDLFNNEGEGVNSTGLYINGAAPTAPGSVNLVGTPIDLRSGRPLDITLSYTLGTLIVGIKDVVTGGSYSTTYSVNIPAIIGTSKAYIGFTGASGGMTAIQDILSWAYNPVPSSPTNVTASAGAGQVTVRWSSSVGAVSYNIYRGTTTGGQGPTPYVANYTSTSFTDNSVVSGVTYFYTIAAVNGGGQSVQSAEVSAIPSGVNFSTGFASAAGRLTLNGSAAIASASGSALRLTSGLKNQFGSAFTTAQHSVSAFITSFRFQITNPNADGFTFAIQNVAPTALGKLGGGLGYGAGGRGGPGGIPKSVAVKFDIYNSQGEGNNSTGLYLNGAAPTNLGSVNLTGTGIDLRSGRPFDVVITYNGITLVVVITDSVTGASATQSYTVNIAAQLGSSTGFVGFTGATGGLTATQDIRSWTFTPAPPTPTAVRAVTGSASNTLTWATTLGATTYNVYRSTTPGGQGTAPYASNLLSPTFVDTAVNAGVVYFYKVSAVNAAGESALSAEATQAIINYSIGFTSAGTALTYNGRAGVSTPSVVNGRLRLTSGIANEATSVFSATAVSVAAFTTQFSFQLTNPAADGFTFAIAGSPTALGAFGGALGYGPGNVPGIAGSVAIKFDLYSNAGEGGNSTGIYLNGALPTTAGSFDLTSSGIDLHSGRIFNAVITYDGAVLTVTLVDSVTGAKSIRSYTVNIPSIVGSSSAYVGFTAGTGGLKSTQEILKWTYAI